MLDVVRHYYPGDRPVESLYTPHLDREGVAERLGRMTEGRGRVWLVYARPWDNDAEGHILSFLDSSAERAEQLSLPGVELILFDLGSPSR